MEKISRRQFKMVLLGIIFVTFLVFVVLDAISIYRTNFIMETLKNKLINYFKSHNSLPSTLEELSNSEKIPFSIKDAWGRKIFYSIEAGNKVTLTSFGRDGQPEGKDENSDIITIFHAYK